jgi:hypothetical protein
MQRLSKSSQGESVDPVMERLFRRFQAVYGSQKVSVMWDSMPGNPDEVMREVMGVWGKKLARFHPAVIGKALDEIVDNGNPWPPSLSEFAKQCLDAEDRLKGEQRMIALPAPSDLADPDSPAVAEFRAEMRRFLGKRRMPS